MKTKKLGPGDVDKMPRGHWRASYLTPEQHAQLDAEKVFSDRITGGVKAIGLEWNGIHGGGGAHGERVVGVKDSDGREGLFVICTDEPDFADPTTWPAKIKWKGVISDEEGWKFEQELSTRYRWIADFGGIWFKPGSPPPAVYGPVLEPGDENN
jgi:hypothetical protein